METCSYEKKLNKIKIVRLTKDVVVQNKDEGTILLSGILEEQTNVSKQIESDKSDNSHSSAEDDSDKESSCSSKSSGNDAVSERNNSVFDDDDDDGSQCNMDESAYYATTESNEKHVSGFDLTNEYPSNKETQGNDDDNENVYLGDEWQWNQWEPHNIDDDIEGPNKGDRYEGPHGLRKNISKRFCTVLQCLFETTAMNRGFFVRLCGESNKYARNIMRERNTTLFLGHKWTNITVEEMVHFFGILLRISLEPRKMGGYTSYFQESHSITLASGYTCNLQGYQSWAKNVMNLV